MKSGTQVGLAVAAGYLLGRRRKMRLALMLGGAAATGRLGGIGGQLLRRGTKLLGSSDVMGKLSPELGEVTGLIGGELVPVGKAAARAAITSRINALSDQIHDRAEALRVPGEAGADEEEEDVSGDGQRAGSEDEERPARARRPEPEDQEPEYEEPEDEEPEEPRAVSRGRRSSAGAARRAASNGGDRDEDEDVPVRATRRTARSAGGRAGAPVRRTRR